MIWKILMIAERKFRRLNAPHLESITDFKRDKGKGLEVLGKYLKVKDNEALEDVYETYEKNVPDDGAISLRGIQTIIAEELTPEESKGIRAEDLVDLRFAAR